MLEVVKYLKYHLTDRIHIFLDCGNKMKKQTLHEFFPPRWTARPLAAARDYNVCAF